MNLIFVLHSLQPCFQCFDTVSTVTGKASGQ